MIKPDSKAIGSRNATLSRTLPFALFMSFIAVEECTQLAVRHGLLAVPDAAALYLYPAKATAAGALLLKFLGEYDELRFDDLSDWGRTFTVSLLGIVTCLLWICLDWPLTIGGPHRGFDPALLPEGGIRHSLTLVRIAGAVLVVPLMEEIFWRGFLLRYLIDPDFESVPIGSFSWGSFLATTILFGLEHHLVVAGMVAGAIYNLLLYRTQSLAHCVLAHAVTNLALAGFVLLTGRWDFW